MLSTRVGPRTFLRLAQATAVVILLNIVSGASVRLSDSGLGCPDWPDCTRSQVTPPLRFHALIEFGNRMVVVVLVVLCGATVLAAWRRRPYRRDLTWLSVGLIVGVLAEAGVGAAVVYSKLNPYVVMGHFMVGVGLLGVALVLAMRAGHAEGRGTPAVPHRALVMVRVLIALLVVAMVAGTATTGAGPHAGGPGAKRIPVDLVDMTRTHAEIVLATGAFLLVVLWWLWRHDVPADIQQRGHVLLGVMVIQGIVGYTQYFTHLPAVLVGIHVFGASVVFSTLLWFHHDLSRHRPEPELATEGLEALGFEALGLQAAKEPPENEPLAGTPARAR